MLNFDFYNPTRIVFGKATIARLADLVPANAKTLVLYGGGSIKQNGVYQQVTQALAGRKWLEFAGVEPNPHYETCMKAVELARREKVDFLLAVGGGSVIDATKFISISIRYSGDPWEMVLDWSKIGQTVPLGTVLTLPGTGSEMNGGSVISRLGANEKLFFISEKAFPRFSVLDPETTFSLPRRQFANGTVDAFVQVLEQYLTYDVNSPLQDRYSEGILRTLVAEAPKVLANPRDYDVRANIMWCATSALNGVIACGVVQDWASHMMGHELTALYGLDHGQTLAIVMPLVMRHQRARKRQKLLQLAARVWDLTEGNEDARIDQAIARTEAFFVSLGVPVRMRDYGVPPEAPRLVAERLASRKMLIGEHQDLGRREVEELLSQSVA